MKRIPLQEIPFTKHNLDRDIGNGRKRKLPVETKRSFSSKPYQEPSFSQNDFLKLEHDLSESNSASMLFLMLKASRKAVCNPVNETEVVSLSGCSSSSTEDPKQGSSEWFRMRIGKITSSKVPSLIGLAGKKSFCESWSHVRNKTEEERKNFRNFQRGTAFESGIHEVIRFGDLRKQFCATSIFPRYFWCLARSII